MKIKLFNKCSKKIVVRIGCGDGFVLLPLEQKEIQLNPSDKIEIDVRKEEHSFFQKRAFYRKYVLTVETKYSFCCEESNDLLLTFVRETVRITGDTYYDKIVLVEKKDCINEYNSVCEVENIKAVYNRKHFLYGLFISPFEHLTFFCLSAVILAIVFAVKIGWLFSSVFFIASYTVIWIIDGVIKNLSDLFGRKIGGIENDKTEFNAALSECYINDFYKSDTLMAYKGEIDRDEL